MYKIEDVKLGNHVMFKRSGVPDFNMHWTVVGYLNGMIEVRIREMSYIDKVHIDLKDITSLLDVYDNQFFTNKSI
jgi:hypothetical protein